MLRREQKGGKEGQCQCFDKFIQKIRVKGKWAIIVLNRQNVFFWIEDLSIFVNRKEGSNREEKNEYTGEKDS